MGNEGCSTRQADEVVSIVRDVLAGYLSRNSSEAAQAGGAEAVYRFRDSMGTMIEYVLCSRGKFLPGSSAGIVIMK